ncbi:type II secretion system minor pseudopilin GspK [Uliginosibacterium sp. H3]|uniref:Type II secretion system protein K n=1 Tax=Uliginosibacterium silvisoli TaxID=3114758 RepID=A0ABU6KA30_9RHOO|nr:type II secretion system minor pseudopilin GspK [Uliginosibacterium sp. H3]
MSVTYSACSPFARRGLARRRPRQRGAAILMAILTVALVAAVASAIVAEHGAAIEQLEGRSDQAQARWLARGAVDWARNVLQFTKVRGQRELQTGNIDTLTGKWGEWAIRVPPTPVDEGELSGEIEEMSSRFNVNKLVNLGVVDVAQQAIFLRLLVNIGLSESVADAMSDAVIDWMDADDRPRPKGAESAWYAEQRQVILPPQAALLSINELLAVRGMTPALLERLRPHITALPSDADRINVNIATAEVLAAYIANLSLVQARKIVLDRQQRFFTTVADFTARLPAGNSYNATQLDVQSRYFQATGRATWGVASTHMQVLLRRDQGRPEIIRETIL